MSQKILKLFRIKKVTAGVLFLLLLVLISDGSCRQETEPALQLRPEIAATDSTPYQNNEPVYIYGIPANSFNIINGIIKPNQRLSDILLPLGISGYELDQLTRNSKEVFDVRKIRARHNYIILTDNDSAAKVRYFIYEHDPDLSYIFSFNDSLKITEWKTESLSVIRFSSFTIETSLWEAMKRAGVNPELAVALSDIFAWTVDFFGLQRGDKFKVIYEEKQIRDDVTLPGRIYAAMFISGNREYMAIPFVQDSIESYYDYNGESLKKAFLRAPLKFSRITSRYSSARLHPILRIVRPHHGIDYAAPVGTPVYSVGDGSVTETGLDNESGKYVRIKHNSVYSTAYLHLSSFGKGITPGAFVKQGDIIGYVGTSGLSTGPHLDFRFYKNGYPVDPLKVEAPPVEPVREENIEKFIKIRHVIALLLSQIE
ncbi:MAG TPA: peptidoglycan DD-metalloendopeptidase family protein [Bacteroidales bacterium]|nr:peptidoglycan DD-metalloendopeptidase family protein [Bacteroidales bacterium]HOK74623.1 peptidoglycan DD-metalloendopeptidase family protein [Bacteroidales bacterium]HOM39756.1 peptidoglycan DD-metalloendopeptidase family protein [Bacteroidales bacterium]HPP91312.1 peptidoglycan DD-metalloendopeptidase family protein [Bacteroidales bacterium]HQG55663.1 peptidoglycan DD-metalloendopeptidase family protein [Bacteroidales bacterium]